MEENVWPRSIELDGVVYASCLWTFVLNDIAIEFEIFTRVLHWVYIILIVQ